MSTRRILTVSPLTMMWSEENGEVVVKNLSTGRKVYLQGHFSYLWKLINRFSKFEEIKEEFCKRYDEQILLEDLNSLRKAGLIKIFYCYTK